MALPKETIHLGASNTCSTCKQGPLVNEVFRSNSGFYIGTYCNCGPYSRESEYYPTFESAKAALLTDTVKYRTCAYRGE